MWLVKKIMTIFFKPLVSNLHDLQLDRCGNLLEFTIISEEQIVVMYNLDYHSIDKDLLYNSVISPLLCFHFLECYQNTLVKHLIMIILDYLQLQQEFITYKNIIHLIFHWDNFFRYHCIYLFIKDEKLILKDSFVSTYYS